MNTVTETNLSEIGVEENIFPWRLGPGPHSGKAVMASPGVVHWSWACRKLKSVPRVPLENPGSSGPSPGDLALVRVEKTGFHKQLTTAENRRLRLYPGAHFVGVFGNRYASDAYEGSVQGLDKINMLTGAGMIGTVMP